MNITSSMGSNMGSSSIGHMQHIMNQGTTHSPDEIRRQLASLSGVERGQNLSDPEKRALREATQMFEAYFLQIMLREMRRTIPEGGFMPKTNAQRIFTDMLDEEIANSAAQSGGFGLADTMFRQLTMTDYSARVPRATMFQESVLRTVLVQ